MTVRYDPEARTLSCSVRDLLLETIEERFALVPGMGRARQHMGREVHERHQAKQLDLFDSYRREIHVSYSADIDGVATTVTGRIDGAWNDGQTLVVEEIKSVILPGDQLAHLSPNRLAVFEEQAAIYCLMLQAQPQSADPPPPDSLRATVTLVSVLDHTQHRHEVDLARFSIGEHIHDRVRMILAQLRAEEVTIERRQGLARDLPFPFDEFRPNQDRMVEAMVEAAQAGRHIMAAAPTGIGKTSATLFAMGRDALAEGAQLFYVTPKNTQHQLVMSTASRWQRQGHPVRVVAIRAKAKMCLNDVVACHPDLCPYAREYTTKMMHHGLPEGIWQDVRESDDDGDGNRHLPGMDRAPIDMAEVPGALDNVVTPETLVDIGRRTEVCPFELGLDLSLSADVIVGDYNYVFDPQVSLKRFFGDEAEGGVVRKPRLVIDEAHALYDRGCDYYSPSLWVTTFRRAETAGLRLKGDIGREWAAFAAEVADEIDRNARLVRDIGEDGTPLPGPHGERGTFDRELFATWRERCDELHVDYLLWRRLQRKVQVDDAILDASFQFLRFAQAVQLEGPEFTHLVVRGEPERFGIAGLDADGRTGAGGNGPAFSPSDRRDRERRGIGSPYGLQVHCADPSRQLARNIRQFHSVAAVSGTLTPMEYYRQVLGFPASRTDTLELDSPFPRDHLAVIVDRSVTTIYRQRERNVDRIAKAILRAAGVRAGNYLAAFPSYTFMRQVGEHMHDLVSREFNDPDRADEMLRMQATGMSETAREEFLATLEVRPRYPRILLVVQGGIFSEGVDYPGDACVGVFVVGPALPRIGLRQELKKQYFEEQQGEGRGFDFAYLYPGMTRVVQTAGRVIRQDSDIGFVALMDWRFSTPAYQTCFPRWWYRDHPSEIVTRDLARSIRGFWAHHDLIDVDAEW